MKLSVLIQMIRFVIKPPKISVVMPLTIKKLKSVMQSSRLWSKPFNFELGDMLTCSIHFAGILSYGLDFIISLICENYLFEKQ